MCGAHSELTVVWRACCRLSGNRTESSRHWSRAKQAANSFRSCQTSGRRGFYEVLAKGGFHVVVIANGRGDQIELEDSVPLGYTSRSQRSASRFSAQRVTVIHFSVLVAGTKGRKSINPCCYFRIGRTSLRRTLTISSFISGFGVNSTMRPNMMNLHCSLIGETRSEGIACGSIINARLCRHGSKSVTQRTPRCEVQTHSGSDWGSQNLIWSDSLSFFRLEDKGRLPFLPRPNDV